MNLTVGGAPRGDSQIMVQYPDNRREGAPPTDNPIVALWVQAELVLVHKRSVFWCAFGLAPFFYHGWCNFVQLFEGAGAFHVGT